MKLQDVNTPLECPVPAKYLPDVECVETIYPIALHQPVPHNFIILKHNQFHIKIAFF